MGKGIGYLTPAIYHFYLDWLYAMDDSYQVRGPGYTCLSSLRSGKMGIIKERINTSKGCGDVMRVAPVRLAIVPRMPLKQGQHMQL